MKTQPSVVMDPVATALVRLLDEVPTASDVNPGWIAVGVIGALFVATQLLWLSLRRQIGRIRFDEKTDSRTENHEHPPGPPDRP